jgi:DNA-binding transcriptional LysR family regulator
MARVALTAAGQRLRSEAEQALEALGGGLALLEDDVQELRDRARALVATLLGPGADKT